jgi:hypothetical protein
LQRQGALLLRERRRTALAADPELVRAREEARGEREALAEGPARNGQLEGDWRAAGARAERELELRRLLAEAEAVLTGSAAP